MKSEFSEKEIRLLTHFGIEKRLLDGTHFLTLNPTAAYGLAVKEAFLRTESGCYINSLRRVMNESKLGNGYYYRETPEFDDLIQLEDCLD